MIANEVYEYEARKLREGYMKYNLKIRCQALLLIINETLVFRKIFVHNKNRPTGLNRFN